MIACKQHTACDVEFAKKKIHYVSSFQYYPVSFSCHFFKNKYFPRTVILGKTHIHTHNIYMATRNIK
ncbi:hypothetical protein X975_15825, partial [Stegodyphus mimosarum]